MPSAPATPSDAGLMELSTDQQVEIADFVDNECGEMQGQLNAFIDSVLADPGATALSQYKDDAGPTLDELIGDVTKSVVERRASDLDWLEDFIWRQESAMTHMEGAGVRRVSLTQPESTFPVEMSPSPVRQMPEMVPLDGRRQRKVQVFVALSGCPLAKCVLVPLDVSFSQFIGRLESRLNEPDLAVFYEDPADGERIEVDDADSLRVFLDSIVSGRLRVKLVAVPKEYIHARAARALEPSQLRAASQAPSTVCGDSVTDASHATRTTARAARGHWQANLGGFETPARSTFSESPFPTSRTAGGSTVADTAM